MRVLYILLLLCFLLSCSKKNLNLKCRNVEKIIIETTKIKILNQIDSVCSISGYKCDRLDKITNTQCNYNNLLEVEIKTNCKDKKTFYFDKDYKLVRVIHELREIHNPRSRIK